ncbi:unnamed protein product [Porites lobata]|uniref:Uncharacterized protein n=1 Tax=Porites lobata TaxID=104759 RepID=A0ABN8MWZ5_9CNID|nr:unnamed protein product [Porites lobata]
MGFKLFLVFVALTAVINLSGRCRGQSKSSICILIPCGKEDQVNEPSPLKSDELEPNSMKRSHKIRLAELLRNKRQRAYEDFMFENQKE